MKLSLFLNGAFLMFSINAYSQIPTEDLIIHYPFDNHVNDVSGNQYNASNFGGEFSEDRHGHPNGAVTFTSSNDFLLIDHPIDFTPPFSFSLWFSTENDKYAQTFLSNYTHCSYQGNGMNLGLYGTYRNNSPRLDFIIDQPGSGSDRFTQHIDYSDGNWHHIVVNFDVSQTQIYINNELVATEPFTHVPNNSRFKVGNADKVGSNCALGNSLNLEGKMDDVRFYNRTLSDCDISFLHYENVNIREVEIIDTITAVVVFDIITSNPDVDQRSAKIEVYPNPTQEMIYIELGHSELPIEYEMLIFNPSGVEVDNLLITSRFTTHQISNTVNGVYTIQLIDNVSGQLVRSEELVISR